MPQHLNRNEERKKNKIKAKLSCFTLTLRKPKKERKYNDSIRTHNTEI